MLGGLLAILAFAATAPVARADGGGDLAALAARYGFQPDDVGVALLEPATGRLLAEHRADRSFIPASTTKVATALAALETLGPDFRFATALAATGTVRDGALDGDLYLRGGGDPTLDSTGLRALAAALRRAGITRVAGSFCFDDSLYPRALEIDPLQPATATYNPAVGALSVNYNRIELHWRRDGRTRALHASVLSPSALGPLPLRSLGAGVLDQRADPGIELIFEPSPAPRWLLSPRLPARGGLSLPVKSDPGAVAAELFIMLAARAGVELPAARPDTTPPGAREIARVESEPLREVLQGLLAHSNNLTAELVGLAASRQLTGEGLTLSASAERLARWWREQLPDTSFETFAATNHSGLSSTTWHTPRQLARILLHGRTALPPLLRPFVAVDGAEGSPARVKSGTLHWAGGLVGFLHTARGEERGFVILLTDREARRRLDATRDVRIAAPPPGASGWTARAKALQRALVGMWMAEGGNGSNPPAAPPAARTPPVGIRGGGRVAVRPRAGSR